MDWIIIALPVVTLLCNNERHGLYKKSMFILQSAQQTEH